MHAQIYIELYLFEFFKSVNIHKFFLAKNLDRKLKKSQMVNIFFLHTFKIRTS